MKLGLCTIAFRERPLEEVIDIAADHGLDGIEIWGQDPHMPAEYDADYVNKVKDMVSRKGLEISALGSYVNPLMPRYQKHLEEAFKIAQGLGTNLVRIWSGGGPSKTIHPSEKRLIAFRLIPLAQWVQFRRLTLGLEMHNNNLTNSVTSILELIEQVKNCRRSRHTINPLSGQTQMNHMKRYKSSPHTLLMCMPKMRMRVGKPTQLLMVLSITAESLSSWLCTDTMDILKLSLFTPMTNSQHYNVIAITWQVWLEPLMIRCVMFQQTQCNITRVRLAE